MLYSQLSGSKLIARISSFGNENTLKNQIDGDFRGFSPEPVSGLPGRCTGASLAQDARLGQRSSGFAAQREKASTFSNRRINFDNASTVTIPTESNICEETRSPGPVVVGFVIRSSGSPSI